MTADGNSDKTYMVLLFLMLQSRDWVDGGNIPNFSKITPFEILLTVRYGISSKKVVIFEDFWQFLSLRQW